VNSLKRSADTHEIWGSLSSPKDQAINKEMHDNLNELIKDCKKLREVLKFDETYEPVKFIQNILRNLGLFSICMKISSLVLTIDKDGGMMNVSQNTRLLAYESNSLLYWFTIDNPTNQVSLLSFLSVN
jgi:hypothetical protein